MHASSAPSSPNALADELGIDARTLRQFLRDRFPEDAPGQGYRWTLTRAHIAAARARWGTASAERPSS
jgi:hypothetical protein